MKTFGLSTGLTMILMLSFAAASCNRPENPGASGPDEAASPTPAATTSNPGDRLPAPAVDAQPDQADSAEQVAVFGGGCFWCTEAVFERLAGVSAVVSGYAGGQADAADYQSVSSGRTDHAEVIQIRYDPSKVSYGRLLRIFFATHDPTQLNRQGPDVGRQYRSVIFFADEQQKRIARAYIDQLNEAGEFNRPIVTTLEPLEAFHPAEPYHQDFMKNNPGHPYMQMHAIPKLDKLDKQFGDQLKP
jgi:peptide-methionine (S)-S-oxide reductase